VLTSVSDGPRLLHVVCDCGGHYSLANSCKSVEHLMLGQSLFVSYHISDVCFALGIVLTARLSICELLFLFTIALAFSMHCKLGLSVLIKGLSVVVQGHIRHSEGICDLFLAVFL